MLVLLSLAGLALVCKWTTNGSLLAYQGHGISEWKNDAKFFHSFINKNGHVLDRVDYHHCVPKGAIESVKGTKVHFCDGTEEEVDIIIQCTGFKAEFPMLPAEIKTVPLTHNYKYLFNVEDPTLAFIGYVRPVIGSLITMAEVQSFFTAKVFSGMCELPSRDERQRIAVKDKLFWDDYFKDSSRRLSTFFCSLRWQLSSTKSARIPREGVTALAAPDVRDILSNTFTSHPLLAANLVRLLAGCPRRD